MSNPNRGAFIAPLVYGKVIHRNNSLETRGSDVVNNKAISLIGLGLNTSAVYYGDTLIWDEIKLMPLVYGNGNTVKYTTPTTGWTYRYDIINECFEVLDSQNVIVDSIFTRKLSNFGISYDILKSHQFYFYYDIDVNGVEWFIECISGKTRKSIGTNHLDVMFVDKYHNQNIFTSTTHGYEIRLVSAITFLMLSNEISTAIIGIPDRITILRTKNNVRQQRGDYSNFMSFIDVNKPSEAGKKRKSDIFWSYVALFSAMVNSISRMSNIQNNPNSELVECVMEPWVLYEMWKWLSKGNVGINEERIFDISPNWS